MRKIVAGLFMSVDGVVESPERWGFQYFNEELTEAINAAIAESDAVLIGRRTIWSSPSCGRPRGARYPCPTF